MDGNFEFDTYVTGRKFLGRKEDCGLLAGIIVGGDNALLMEPPKSGKLSLIHQTFMNLKDAGQAPVTAFFDMTGVRTMAGFVSGLREAMQLLTQGARAVPADDIVGMLRTPYLVAEDLERPVVFVFTEFQNLDFAEDCEKAYAAFEKVLGERHPAKATYIFSGSRVNAMKDIFGRHLMMRYKTDHIHLSRIPSRELSDHVLRGFQMGGKDISRDLINQRVAMFDCDPWHINTFFAICDAYTRGFITPTVDQDALNSVVAMHTPHYQAMVSTLTGHQLSLLRAMVDGQTKFSTAEVMAQYGLNSSANVKRVKDALCKKEVISFDENGKAYFLDSFFKYWLTRFYFKIS